MSTPICPKCGLYLYVCECLSEVELQFWQNMVERWYEYGCDDSMFGPDELEMIYSLTGGRGGGTTQRWDKYKMSSNSEYGYQNNAYFGTEGKGEHGHIALDPEGNILYARDEYGNVLFDKANGIDKLPPGSDR